MNKINNKNSKMTILIIILIVSLLGTTYAFVNLSSISNNSITGEGDCMLVNYSAQTISAGSLVAAPRPSDTSKSTVTLSQNSNCQIYTEASIYLKTNTENNMTTAPIGDTDYPQALKFEVYEGDTKVNTNGVVVNLDNTTATLKNSGTINSTSDILLADKLELDTDAQIYSIYIWIDSTESYGYYNGKTYSGYIYAISTQTSTIKE